MSNFQKEISYITTHRVHQSIHDRQKVCEATLQRKVSIRQLMDTAWHVYTLSVKNNEEILYSLRTTLSTLEEERKYVQKRLETFQHFKSQASSSQKPHLTSRLNRIENRQQVLLKLLRAMSIYVNAPALIDNETDEEPEAERAFLEEQLFLLTKTALNTDSDTPTPS